MSLMHFIDHTDCISFNGMRAFGLENEHTIRRVEENKYRPAQKMSVRIASSSNKGSRELAQMSRLAAAARVYNA